MGDPVLDAERIDTETERLHWQLRPGNDRCRHADRVRVFAYLDDIDELRARAAAAERRADEAATIAERYARGGGPQVSRVCAQILAALAAGNAEPLRERAEAAGYLLDLQDARRAVANLLDELERGDGEEPDWFGRKRTRMEQARAILRAAGSAEPAPEQRTWMGAGIEIQYEPAACRTCGETDPAKRGMHRVWNGPVIFSPPQRCDDAFHAGGSGTAPEACPTCGSTDPAVTLFACGPLSFDGVPDPFHTGTP